MKICRLIFLAILFAFLRSSISYAQNNDYKINDNLYTYFLKVNKNLDKKGLGLRMTDTLFVRSKQLRDLKAQCMALYLRIDYYHFCLEYEKEKVEFRRIAPFILKTPYLQYYFGAWVTIISDDMDSGKYVEATAQLAEMQKSAMRYKNDYGIMRSYSLLGDLYFQQGIHYLSYFQYKKALDYGIRNKMKDMMHPYYDIAQACIALRRWSEGENYLLQSIGYSTDLYTLTSPYTLLLKLYCIEDTIDNKKVDDAFNRLQQLHDSIPIMGERLIHYNQAMYYYYQFYKNDSLTAEKYRTQYIPVDSLSYYKYFGKKYEAEKNYRTACDYYSAYSEYYFTSNSQREQLQHALLVPQFEYQKVKMKNNELLQRQAKIKIKEEKSKACLLTLNNEKDRAYLFDKLKERLTLQNQLKSRELCMQQQSKQIAYNKLNLQHKIETQHLFRRSEYWKMVFLVFISLIILSLIGFFILLKLKEKKRLKEEKIKAEISERTKSLFFQNMNHEIRSPLNAIIGFNEVLCSDVANTLSNEEKDSFINMISTNSELLLTLVNDVLDLSNFESGTYKLVPVDVDINELCHTTVESIRGREAKGVNLSFKSGAPFVLHTDAQRLQQVLVNYLTNACKYTETGHIILSYEVLDDIVRFAVTDTGRGVKPEDAEKVFQRFQMLDKSKRGTGLGLHICRLVSNLLHGKTYVDTSYTGGARFVFDHPIKGAIALLIGLLFSFQPLKAQHNPQGILDKLYPYYESAYNELGANDFIPFLNRFKTKANNEKDVRAQFYIQYLEASHHNVRSNSEVAFNMFNNCRAFAFRHHLSYQYYLAWYSMIDAQIVLHKSREALHQLVEFQKSTLKIKNPDIISLFLLSAADFYLDAHHYSTAMSYLRQSLNFSKRAFKGLIYAQISDCYYSIDKYKEATEIGSKAVIGQPRNAYIIEPAARLLLVYSTLCDEKNADKYFNILESLKSKYSHILGNNSIYQDAVRSYYTNVKKDEKKGQEATKDDQSAAISFNVANYRYSIEQYESAMYLYADYMKKVDEYIRNKNTLMFESFATKFDYDQDLAHQKQLELSNIRMRLQQIENNGNLLELARQQTRWVLDKEIANANQKKSEIALRDSRLAQQQQSMNQQRMVRQNLQREEQLTNQRFRWMSLTFSIFALLLISAALAVFIRLRRKDKKLKQEADAAIEIEREKNLFFENINGKIRQPLNIIIGLNREMAQITEANSVKRTDILEVLKNSGDYLTKVVNRVLDISKMESGTFKLHYTFIDFHQLCMLELEKVKGKARSGVEVIFHPAPSKETPSDNPCVINTDGEQLKFVLDAYLENAIENTYKGSIILSYDIFPDKISFSVIDTGRGVDKDMIDKIFYCERLQCKDAHIGMSLHIVRLLAEQMDGKAYLDTNYTDGTRFVFEIPIKK